MNTCDSVDWYEGDVCVLTSGHDGSHRDQFGMTWDRGAGTLSVYRVNGPWWPERGHVLSKYLPTDCTMRPKRERTEET